MSALDAVELVDSLYRRAVESPTSIDESMLAEWMEEALESISHDRVQVKALRQAVRLARKMATRFELEPRRFPDWRNGVDEALGTRGWDPQLDLVRNELASAPSAVVFDAMKERHRAVHFSEWMEGVSFEEWRADRES